MTRLCIDCGKDTAYDHDYYMVHDYIWARTGLGKKDGMLCVEHLEIRLGRQIAVEDLTWAPINYMTGIRAFLLYRSGRFDELCDLIVAGLC